jgi:ubiquinone/menaquinone biosynthesis C-methylase UbiE
VTVSDAERFLAATDRTWDVVSCFSLLHHFALGRASIGPEELLHLLDRVTGRVLYLDTGQAHEAWFRESLPEWDTEYVRAYLSRHTTFDEVVDLGPDCDDVPPYQHNYGRHLFAAVRNS